MYAMSLGCAARHATTTVAREMLRHSTVTQIPTYLVRRELEARSTSCSHAQGPALCVVLHAEDRKRQPSRHARCSTSSAVTRALCHWRAGVVLDAAEIESCAMPARFS
jgi:hypothetical protein